MPGVPDDTLSTPFMFVPHDDPEPLEWMQAHPGWVKFPATMVPRPSPEQLAPHSASEPSRPRPRFSGGSPWDVPAGMRSPGEGVPHDPAPPDAELSLSDFVATYNHASRLIGAPPLTPPAPAEPPDFFGGMGRGAAELLGIPAARAQPVEDEPSRRGAPDPADPEPAEALRLQRFGAAMRAIRAVEPDNPQLTYLATPEFIPDEATVERVEAEARDATARRARRLRVDRALPEGFRDQAALQRFTEQLRKRLAEGGITDESIGLVGSSVTGVRYSTGAPFGPESDLDVYVLSPELLSRAKERGMELRSGGTRTRSIKLARDAKNLGLPASTVGELSKLAAGRNVSVMIYGGAEALLS